MCGVDRAGTVCQKGGLLLKAASDEAAEAFRTQPGYGSSPSRLLESRLTAVRQAEGFSKFSGHPSRDLAQFPWAWHSLEGFAGLHARLQPTDGRLRCCRVFQFDKAVHRSAHSLGTKFIKGSLQGRDRHVRRTQGTPSLRLILFYFSTSTITTPQTVSRVLPTAKQTV